MTKARKFLGMMMAALLCFALTPTAAFAVGENCEITIENAKKGQQYDLYKIADLAVAGTEEAPSSYTYTPAEGWAPFWNSIAADAKYGISIVNGNIVFDGESMTDNDATIADLAVAAKGYDQKPAATRTATAETDGRLSFGGLDFGYYFMNSTTGTICSLTSLNDQVGIYDKNDVPTADMQVQGPENAWLENKDASISDVLQFRSVVYIAKGASNYIYHNTLSEALTRQGDVLIYAASENADGVVVKGDQIAEGYTVNDTPNGECTFEITLDPSLLEANAEGFIVIEYSAQLNNQAAVTTTTSGLQPNTNTAWLTYGDNNTRSEEDTTNTYTFSFDVYKYSGTVDNPLAGASFMLKRTQGGDDVAALTFTGAEGSTVFVYNQYGADDTFQTTDTGTFTLSGLASGEYYLYETAAPQGYNKLDEPVRVQINGENGMITVGMGEDAVQTDRVEVENKTGAQLPTTGGMGTTVIYVVGAVLVIGAVIFFVRRRSAAK